MNNDYVSLLNQRFPRHTANKPLSRKPKNYVQRKEEMPQIKGTSPVGVRGENEQAGDSAALVTVSCPESGSISGILGAPVETLLIWRRGLVSNGPTEIDPDTPEEFWEQDVNGYTPAIPFDSEYHVRYFVPADP